MMRDLFYDIAGEPAVVPSERPMTEMLVVSQDYFRTLDQPLLAGRAFDETDRAGSVTTCIVNEAFVERRLQGRAAIGRTVQVWREEQSAAEPGLFGVLAYTVQKRRREYGVRMALGARPEAVVRHIARGTARLLVPGMAVGAVLAVVVGQFLSAMLFGVRPFDAVTFTVVVAVLVVTAVAAVAGPAFRAMRIDPVGALRSE